MRRSCATLAASGLLVALAGCTGGPPAAGPGTGPTAAAESPGATPPATAGRAVAGGATDGAAGAPSPDEPPTSGTTRIEVAIRDFAYALPERVPPGATIAVTNEDDVLHTFTVRGGAGGGVPPGQTVEFAAPQAPGEYPVVCYFHGAMSSTLVVA